MNDDYLWDKSGEPDAEVQHFERLLGRFGYRPKRRRRLLRGPWPMLAAVMAVAAGLLLVINLRPDIIMPMGSGYRWIEGDHGRVAMAGDVFETGAEGATLELPLGSVHVDPGSRVRIEDTGDEVHALYMDRGALRASIFAAPRLFQVGTPSGLTIDLGCEYTLRVTDDGRSRLSVETGQVAFGYEDREVYVPAGASCESIAGRGPTPPLFDNAPAKRRELVEKLSATGKYCKAPTKFPDEFDEELLAELLAFEEREDALPLFAMMTDPGLPLAMRSAIYDRLAKVLDKPEGCTKNGVIAGDPRMREDWLEEIEHWWR